MVDEKEQYKGNDLTEYELINKYCKPRTEEGKKLKVIMLKLAKENEDA